MKIMLQRSLRLMLLSPLMLLAMLVAQPAIAQTQAIAPDSSADTPSDLPDTLKPIESEIIELEAVAPEVLPEVLPEITLEAPAVSSTTPIDIALIAPAVGDIALIDIAPASTLPVDRPDSAPSTTPSRDTSTLLHQLSHDPLQGSIDQVTSVSQLTDVQPTDWAFQALQSLVERYGVIAGYPDGTYRGNRALTRYEFAAGLNAALDRVNELIAAGLADAVTREDLATLQRLQAEFAAELATLRGRADALEARTTLLEENQFSTTTQLRGEVLFGLFSVLGGENAAGERIDRVPTFGQRAQLNLETSFTGTDRLTTRLQANNVTPLGGTNAGVTLTNEGRLEFDGTTNNDFRLSLLRYAVPLGEQTNLYIAAAGNGFVDLDASAQLNPYFDGSAVSLFALRNPIYNYSAGTGLGIRHFFGDALEINLGYLTPTAFDPIPGRGLFDGTYGALAQAIFNITERSRVGLTYINSYTPALEAFGLATGSNLANEDFGRPVVVNSYGLSGTFTLSPRFALGGWVGYSNHRYIGRGDADVWNWAVTIAFPDLFSPGSSGGILIGMEPRVTAIDSTLNNGQPDQDVSLHLEAFYRYVLSDNIEVTPGLIWITAPDHNANNEDLIVGVLRTVFRF